MSAEKGRQVRNVHKRNDRRDPSAVLVIKKKGMEAETVSKLDDKTTALRQGPIDATKPSVRTTPNGTHSNNPPPTPPHIRRLSATVTNTPQPITAHSTTVPIPTNRRSPPTHPHPSPPQAPLILLASCISFCIIVTRPA